MSSPIEELVDAVKARLALGPEAGPLVQEVLRAIVSEPGGLKGFLDKLNASGLGAQASSWIGKADSPPLSTQGAVHAFGAETIAKLANKAGVRPWRRGRRARLCDAENHRLPDRGRDHSVRHAGGGRGFSGRKPRWRRDGGHTPHLDGGARAGRGGPQGGRHRAEAMDFTRHHHHPRPGVPRPLLGREERAPRAARASRDDPGSALLDHDGFGLNQSKIMIAIDAGI